MAKLDPAVVAHLEWLGFVQPTGLVVSAPALVRAGAILDRSDIEGQRLLRACVEEREFDPKDGPTSWLPDFATFAHGVLGWSFSPKGYAGTAENPIPTDLEVPLADYGETLRPDFAVRERDPGEGQPEWQLLVRVLDPGQDFDRVARDGGHLEASAHGRMERLLRETRVPAGMLFNGRTIRVVSAPRGESSGWLDFQVADMVQTSGRPISTALRLLLSESRLLSLPPSQRFGALLDDSRKFQNEVSERLAEQVLHALYELLHGFQYAHDASRGELLREPLSEHPDEVYRALLTVMLRLVFLLYAEERDMLPENETFLRYYSVAGLYERLREDAALFPDTMDQRYGAWSQLIVLFRLVYDGADVGGLHLPKRHGALFDPDRFRFLDGRTADGAAPLVPDGTIYRALDKLLVLDGERISYRALDVEQIGSVYETMMGFKLEQATGRSVAIKSSRRRGAPIVIDLDMLLEQPADSRDKWVADRADRKLTDTVKESVKEALTPNDLHSALQPIVDTAATPDLVAKGTMIFQPSEERRRSGSHYTPRALTEPIVRTALEPILDSLRGNNRNAPTPEQILDLKVCDPAMGSGAFLVEACRQLAEALVEAWHVHQGVPMIPPDEDEVLYARRLVAQRCLYGVDRNPVAVDLAKMSLWLVTLAKDHALTFLDHALKHGDSLVGLSTKQIEAFHWAPDSSRFEAGFETLSIGEHVAKIADLRRSIQQANDEVPDQAVRVLWEEAERELGEVRIVGDLALAALMEFASDRERESKRLLYAHAIIAGQTGQYLTWLAAWRRAELPLAPFHWELEFPEVFGRVAPGFDVAVGNPPFLGGKQMPTHLGPSYCFALKELFSESKGAADLCAFFFRRTFDTLRRGGCLGLLATKSIAETATRVVGLDRITQDGGEIFHAQTNFAWPGTASVIVSAVFISKGTSVARKELNGKPCRSITSSLTADLDLRNAKRLSHGIAYSQGVGLLDAGAFIRNRPDIPELLSENPGLARYLRVYVNGDVLNGTPDCDGGLVAIDFGEREREEIEGCDQILKELSELVMRQRSKQTRQIHEVRPWLFWDKRTSFYASARRKSRMIVVARVSSHFAFHFADPEKLFADGLKMFDDDRFGLLGVLQSRLHEVWANATSSRFGKSLRYSTSTSFDTFPLRAKAVGALAVADAAEEYLRKRQQLLWQFNVGTTDLYGKFHDPSDDTAGIVQLRKAHAALDEAVVHAYGWDGFPTACEFVGDSGTVTSSDTLQDRVRYRWPDSVRDEALERLLELNDQRAKDDLRSGRVVTTQVERSNSERSIKATQTEALFQ